MADVERIDLGQKLSKEQILELVAKKEKGDKAARDELIIGCRRLVIWVVKNLSEDYQKRIDFDDLVSIGTIGLIKAIDASRSEYFDNGFTRFLVNSIRNEIYMYFRKKITKEDNISIDELEECSGAYIQYNFGDDSAQDMFLYCEREERIRDVRKAVESLPGREKTSVYMFYLQGIKQAQIAKEMHTDPGQISREIKRALKRMKDMLMEE